jgi:hypothetical protein
LLTSLLAFLETHRKAALEQKMAGKEDALLVQCGIAVAARRNQFQVTEGIQTPEHFGALTASDVPELAKRAQSRGAAARLAALGMVQIEKLQALVQRC